MRWLVVSAGLLCVLTAAVPVLAQTEMPSPKALFKTNGEENSRVLDSFEFTGLRHISPEAVAAQLSLRPGNPFEAEKLQHDLHTLGRLGWFASIRVEESPSSMPGAQASTSKPYIHLIFHFEEEPTLSRVEYSGSRSVSTNQVEKLLEEKKLAPGLGKPAESVTLQRIALTIRSALNELAHPDASVQILRQPQENGTVRVRFEIADGPHLPVRQVRFEGNSGVSEKLLRAQMQSITPWKPLASLRGKDAYTQAAFEEDRQRFLTYYQSHGYPEARVGGALVDKVARTSRKWFPFPHHAAETGLSLSIPVQAGPFYRLASIEPSPALEHALGDHHGKRLPFPVPDPDHAFSQQEVDKFRRYYSAHLQSRDSQSNTAPFQAVDASPIFDPVEHSVRLKLNLSDSPPYLVRRIELQGLHKFNDRFVRRRIPLRESQPLDERALETGLTKLARTGYFKPIRKDNIHIQFDDTRHTADVAIHLEEIGQQRVTFDGGRAQFGSTLGLAYTVFDLFSHEELLSAKLEGGPESLQLLLGIAKDGIFGTRSSLAFSIFNNVIRPRFVRGVQGPFTTSHSEGINVPWTYSLTNSDFVGVNYTLSRTTSDQTFGAASSTTGSPIDLRTHTSSRSVGTSWAHDSGSERVLFANSVSGGLLGGDENMLRSSGDAARIFRDPLFSPANSWAFRTSFSAAGSYRGDMLFYSWFFLGDEYVRGLRAGDLGPMVMTEHATPSGTFISSPSYAGANLITAANAEYRIPFHNGVEAAGFFDLGSGWLLPNWLGASKPNLLSATNGVLHGSTGIQMQWSIPGVRVPFRSYYAVNVLRLDRLMRLSDKSLLHAHNRFGAFGWGLGSFF